MEELARHLLLCVIFQSTSGDCKATLRFRSSQQPPSNCRRYCQKLTKPSKFRHLIAVRARARNAAQMICDGPSCWWSQRSQQRPGPHQITFFSEKKDPSLLDAEICGDPRSTELLFGWCWRPQICWNDPLSPISQNVSCLQYSQIPYILLPNSQFQYLLKSLQSLFIFQSASFETGLSISLLVASPKLLVYVCLILD